MEVGLEAPLRSAVGMGNVVPRLRLRAGELTNSGHGGTGSPGEGLGAGGSHTPWVGARPGQPRAGEIPGCGQKDSIDRIGQDLADLALSATTLGPPLAEDLLDPRLGLLPAGALRALEHADFVSGEITTEFVKELGYEE